VRGRETLGVKRIKLNKKEVPKTQEPVEFSVLSKEWIEENFKQIAMGLTVIVVVLGVVWGVDAYRKNQDARACEAYSMILQDWPTEGDSSQEAWQTSIAKLEAFMKQHGGTTCALNAQLSLAQAYFETKQLDAALKWTTTTLDKVRSNPTLQLPANYLAGNLYQALGRTDEAITQWTQFKTQAPPELAREISWKLALLYESKGDLTQAVENCETAVKASGSYPANGLLQEQLALLKGKLVGKAMP
jgi:predicted negative regulator of RcsB-dependent stress response